MKYDNIVTTYYSKTGYLTPFSTARGTVRARFSYPTEIVVRHESQVKTRVGEGRHSAEGSKIRRSPAEDFSPTAHGALQISFDIRMEPGEDRIGLANSLLGRGDMDELIFILEQKKPTITRSVAPGAIFRFTLSIPSDRICL